jgi:hypothetical protein
MNGASLEPVTTMALPYPQIGGRFWRQGLILNLSFF